MRELFIPIKTLNLERKRDTHTHTCSEDVRSKDPAVLIMVCV